MYLRYFNARATNRKFKASARVAIKATRGSVNSNLNVLYRSIDACLKPKVAID